MPDTLGEPQRAAAASARLIRGAGVHAPDTAVDGGRFGDLEVRAASVRGTFGRYNGTAREDDYALGRTADEGWLVVALADGVSSASAAHLGATLAVRTAVQQCVRQLDEGGVDAVDPHGVMQSVAYQLRRAAEPLLARSDLEVTAERISGLVATTLVVAVIPAAGQGPARLFRVGDSNAWRLREGRWSPLLAAKPDDPVASAVTTPLPALPDVVEQVDVEVGADLLLLASDGVTDPFGPDADSPVAAYLADAWAAGLPAPLEFARQIAFRGRSWDDDRTAVALRRVPA